MKIGFPGNIILVSWLIHHQFLSPMAKCRILVFFQFLATCRDTYSIPPSNSIMQPGDGKTISEARALCSEDFSDLTPLIDGNVAFSTVSK